MTYEEYLKENNRISPVQAKETRLARVQEIVSRMTPDMLQKLIFGIVAHAEQPDGDESGLPDDECERYWQAHHDGKIDVCRSLLINTGLGWEAPLFPNDNDADWDQPDDEDED